MFKRLRNKFLVLNMTIITILLLGAFSIVYAFTFLQVQDNIDTRLSRTINVNHEFGRRQGNRPMPPNDNGNPETFEPPAQLSIDFSLKTDYAGNITEINSIFDIEDQVYEYIAKTAAASNNKSGQFKFDDTSWAYLKTPLETGGYHIAVLDISRERDLLHDLIFTFLSVAIIALFIIFLISLFFTNRAIHPVEAVWEKQNQFITDASHELKTPLTTINTNVDVLLSHPDSSIKEERKWLEYIKGEAERMTRLTNDLLYLARLGNGDDSSMHHIFSLSEAVQTVLLTMEAVIFERNLELSEFIGDNISFKGNPDQLKQLTMILLDNAVKYTAEGGKITVSLKKQDKKILLSVANTGEPVSPENREKIFDRFYREDRSRARKSGGYGLGLSIAKAICQQHNSQITLQSLNGENIFTVIMPCS